MQTVGICRTAQFIRRVSVPSVVDKQELLLATKTSNS